MEHRAKVDQFVAYAESRGVDPWTAAPPLFRWLWSRGSRIPPPHFLGFGQLAAVSGFAFGLLFGATMWALLAAIGPERPFGISPVWLPVISGVPFGLTVAAYYRGSARSLGLPSWGKWPLRGGAGGRQEKRGSA